MATDEISRRLGEAKFKEMFLSLTTQAMKKALEEAGLAAVRLPTHSSTRKRNEDWAGRLWRAVSAGKPSVVVLYQWLTMQRRPMLAAFLDQLGVAHDNGLTEADFWNEADGERIVAAGRSLLESGKFDTREAAAYLFFLDTQTKDDSESKLAPLRGQMERHLPPV